MDTPTFQVGDLVMIAEDFVRPAHRGITYRVTRTLKVNLELEPVTGGQLVRANPQALVPAPPEADPQTTPVTGVAYQPRLHPGQIVTAAGPGWREPPDVLYIVLRHRPGDKVSIAKLGGDQRGPLLAPRPPQHAHRRRSRPGHQAQQQLVDACRSSAGPWPGLPKVHDDRPAATGSRPPNPDDAAGHPPEPGPAHPVRALRPAKRHGPHRTRQATEKGEHPL